MPKKQFENDVKCEISSSVLKSLVSRYWWQSWYSNPKKVLDVKMAMDAVKDKTGDTFDWNKGKWVEGTPPSEKKILIISKDLEDFINWKRNSKFSHNKLVVPTVFIDGKSTYKCIQDPEDLWLFGVDSLIETEHAKENPKYEKIISDSNRLYGFKK